MRKYYSDILEQLDTRDAASPCEASLLVCDTMPESFVDGREGLAARVGNFMLRIHRLQIATGAAVIVIQHRLDAIKNEEVQRLKQKLQPKAPKTVGRPSNGT